MLEEIYEEVKDAMTRALDALRRDLSSIRTGRASASLLDGIRRGFSPGPNMVVCGRPVTITGGHMWYCGSEADGERNVRQEVRQLVKEGADFIKIVKPMAL